MKRHNEMTEGIPGKESKDAEIKEEHQKKMENTDIEKVLEIILGLDQKPMQMTDGVNKIEEKTLIEQAKAFRKEFEEIRGR